ncbi:hypothetical protein AX17_006442 [Amanita inopinata Kibby_2008]|nr:hypothetical protein AX17_006442 [Amanita inopinata Kibby_2008]
MSFFGLVACLTSISLFFYILRRSKKRSSDNFSLPPGPRKRFLVGNLMDMPKEFEWVQYHEWCKEFDTDILHLDMMGTPIIILDTSEVTTELLEKRSTIYSGRMWSTMVHDLMGWDFGIAFKNYGK